MKYFSQNFPGAFRNIVELPSYPPSLYPYPVVSTSFPVTGDPDVSTSCLFPVPWHPDVSSSAPYPVSGYPYISGPRPYNHPFGRRWRDFRVTAYHTGEHGEGHRDCYQKGE